MKSGLHHKKTRWHRPNGPSCAHRAPRPGHSVNRVAAAHAWRPQREPSAALRKATTCRGGRGCRPGMGRKAAENHVNRTQVSDACHGLKTQLCRRSAHSKASLRHAYARRAGALTHSFKLGEPVGTKARPVLCYKTAKAACTAKYLTDFKEGGLAKGIERMLLLLEVGCAGEGSDSILASGASGQLYISQATPIKLCPLPAAAIASTQPRTCLCHFASSDSARQQP